MIIDTKKTNKTPKDQCIIIKTKEIMRTSNETIKVTANQSKRTFTIRKYIDSKLFAKYRTILMTKEEFNSESMNTENDWKQFLTTPDYYAV